MAEAVVSVAIVTLRDLLLEEGRFLSDVGGEVRALQTKLEEMKSLLKDADAKQHRSESVRSWIKQIRDLAYRAEDAIETYAVEVSSKRGRGHKKLLQRFSCIMKEFYSRHQIASEISQIKSELDEVRKSMRDYGIRSIIQGEIAVTNDNQLWKRQTFPHFKIGDCFVGKDDELKQIVSLLVDDEHQQHRVVSIWGMGGSGKTTIARKAYHHDDTKLCFQGFAWACISQQCNIRSVLEDVLKQLKNDVTPGLSNTQLIEELCQIQKAKPCIIVLDDLWEIDHWDGLKHAFLVEGLESKILVTTRNQNVAAIGFPIRLGLLSMDSGWELLKMKAFPGTNNPDFACDENLIRNVGEEMVKRCGFLPLAISLLGGVLSRRKSMKEWVLVKENINTYLYRSVDSKKEKEVEAVLNLSYEDLPYYLKPCFLYLSIFKEDKLIHANDIYKIWIAHGMISRENREDESLDVIAELYLRELASRSIVEFEEYDEDSKSEKLNLVFKLHDVVRELCLLIVEREGFGVQRLYYQGGNSPRDSLSGVKTRHLAIHFEGEDGAKLARHEFAISGIEDTCNNVRSLLLDNCSDKIEFQKIGIDLQTFKLLRVLHFSWLKFGKRNSPEGIGNLIHLRYLCFQFCKLDEVPSSIRNLRYLQTLNLTSSWNVRVPNVLDKLLRLKHLMLPEYYGDEVGEYPLKLDDCLDELETLTGFDSSMHQIKSVTRLKNLRKFGAKVRDNESLSQVMDALNREWNKLQHCSVVTMEGCNITATDEGLEVLKKVFTCPHLHDLTIYVKIGKQLNKCANCVSSSSIVDLRLVECEIEDNPMEILGKLPELRRLYLDFLAFLGEEMVCPAFSFPRLKELRLWVLPNLREWRVEEGAMPLLSEIDIIECPNLMMLSDGLRFISSLNILRIRKMPHLAKRVLVSEDDDGQGGEDFHKVRHVPSIIIDY